MIMTTNEGVASCMQDDIIGIYNDVMYLVLSQVHI